MASSTPFSALIPDHPCPSDFAVQGMQGDLASFSGHFAARIPLAGARRSASSVRPLHPDTDASMAAPIGGYALAVSAT
jgi:hypothetical protein